MAYCFRIRCNLSPRTRLGGDVSEIALNALGGEEITLRAAGKDEAGNRHTLDHASEVAIIGRSYDTKGQATEAAETWLGTVQKAFARVNVGADFGDRAGNKSFFFKAGLKVVEEQVGQRTENDVHGITVFECDPWPLFVSSNVRIHTSPGAKRLSAAIDEAIEAAASMTAKERTAYNLYASSFFAQYEDARFALLMMAVEVLIDPQPRPDEVLTHVDQLIAATESSGLPQSEINSIVGSLRWLRNESIGQAGRKLAKLLRGQTYTEAEETSEEFFTRCYNLRGRLFHGGDPYPTREEVGERAAALELFVSHLLTLEF
jgi:hypothetical protein